MSGTVSVMTRKRLSLSLRALSAAISLVFPITMTLTGARAIPQRNLSGDQAAGNWTIVQCRLAGDIRWSIGASSSEILNPKGYAGGNPREAGRASRRYRLI